MEATTQLLLKGKDLLVKHGWVQGIFFGGGKYCVLGALDQAWYQLPSDRETEPWIEAGEQLAQVLVGTFAPHHVARRLLAQWNDEEGRTKDEVVALYDKAIKESVDARGTLTT